MPPFFWPLLEDATFKEREARTGFIEDSRTHRAPQAHSVWPPDSLQALETQPPVQTAPASLRAWVLSFCVSRLAAKTPLAGSPQLPLTSGDLADSEETVLFRAGQFLDPADIWSSSLPFVYKPAVQSPHPPPPPLGGWHTAAPLTLRLRHPRAARMPQILLKAFKPLGPQPAHGAWPLLPAETTARSPVSVPPPPLPPDPPWCGPRGPCVSLICGPHHT